jgi:hypothetical protein
VLPVNSILAAITAIRKAAFLWKSKTLLNKIQKSIEKIAKVKIAGHKKGQEKKRKKNQFARDFAMRM